MIPGAREPFHKLRILVAEDDLSSQRLLLDTLKKMGHAVTTAMTETRF
jgi:CheY-like chemotaxis protein